MSRDFRPGDHVEIIRSEIPELIGERCTVMTVQLGSDPRGTRYGQPCVELDIPAERWPCCVPGPCGGVQIAPRCLRKLGGDYDGREARDWLECQWRPSLRVLDEIS